MTLEEIEKLCNQATPAPWEFEKTDFHDTWYSIGPKVVRGWANSQDCNEYDLRLMLILRNKAHKLLAIVKMAEIVCKDHDLLCEDSNNTLCALNDALLDLENE